MMIHIQRRRALPRHVLGARGFSGGTAPGLHNVMWFESHMQPQLAERLAYGKLPAKSVIVSCHIGHH